MASIFQDAIDGINDLISGAGSVVSNVTNQAGSIFTSLSDIARAQIAADTQRSNQNNTNANPANFSTYFTTDNLIIAGGVVLFAVAIFNLLKK